MSQVQFSIHFPVFYSMIIPFQHLNWQTSCYPTPKFPLGQVKILKPTQAAAAYQME